MKAFRISFLSIHLPSIVNHKFYDIDKKSYKYLPNYFDLLIKNVKNKLKMNNKNIIKGISKLKVSDDNIKNKKEDNKGKIT